MALHVNGVEVDGLHVNDVSVEEVYLNGVSVFKPFTTNPNYFSFQVDGSTVTTRSVVPHPSGDVIVTMLKSGGDALSRWRGDGTHVWTVQATVDNRVPQLYDSAVLAGGDIVTVGRVIGRGLYIARWAEDGTHVWSKILKGPKYKHDTYHAVTVLATGEIMAAGFQNSYNNNSSTGDLVVSKWSDAGLHNWTKTWGSYHNDRYSDAVPLPTGDVVTVGYAGGIGVITRWTPTQTLVWHRGLSDGVGTVYVAAALHSSGDIIAVGTSSLDLGVVSRWAPDGTHVWSRRLRGSDSDFYDVTALPNGEIIVVGRVSAGGYPTTYHLTVHRWGADGTLLEVNRMYDGPISLERLTALPDGGVFLIGRSWVMTVPPGDMPIDVTAGDPDYVWYLGSNSSVDITTLGRTPGHMFRSLYYTSEDKAATVSTLTVTIT